MLWGSWVHMTTESVGSGALVPQQKSHVPQLRLDAAKQTNKQKKIAIKKKKKYPSGCLMGAGLEGEAGHSSFSS